MQKRFLKILVWLGLMSVLTVLAMGAWMVIWHGSQSTESLKWLQLLQTMGTFLLPPILCAWLWDSNHQPFRWLHMDKGASWQVFALAVLIMICAIPAINLLADLNSRISLPDSMASIERWMRAMEENAAALTERFLQAGNAGQLLLNIGLMALLPAIAEELSFRGTLQQVLDGDPASRIRTHTAIWVTAFIFSAIHMQFYGFIPRMLMGAMFGYVFVWTGSLWIPILMHFTNNCMAVISYHLLGGAESTNVSGKSIADTIGAGDTWWLGVLSLIVVGILLYLLTSLGPQGYDRRTHKE
ncbi:MAG: CPBP family intramembrane metalloprotease [Paludibacteraceae bacterium]|nr:CPBP family intramembrane metalloprotease [Paludibacteraceae bacterium]